MVLPDGVARRLTSSRDVGSPIAARVMRAGSVASIAWQISRPEVSGPASTRFADAYRVRGGRRRLRTGTR